MLGARSVRGLVLAASAVLSVAILGGGLWVTFLYQGAVELDCDPLDDHDSVSMADLISLKEHAATYQRDPAPDATLRLTGHQLTLVVGERRDLHMHFEAIGSKVRVLATIPMDDGCYNIEFQGQVAIREARVFVQVESLIVGTSDLTTLASVKPWQFEVEDVPDERIAGMVGNTRSLRVRDGLFEVQLRNRWDLW